MELVDGDVRCVIVVRVLDVNHGLVVLPLFQRVGAVGDEAGFGSPCARVGLPVSSSFDGSFVDRHVDRERKQVHHVRARSVQRELDLVITVVLDHDLALVVLLEDVEQVTVVRSSVRVSRALPGVDEVFRGQRVAVGPFLPGLQVDGVLGAVSGDLRHAVCQSRNDVVVRVRGVQTDEGVGRQGSAVNGRVEGRVKVIGFRSEVDAHDINGVAVLLRVHEVLGAEEGGEVAAEFGLLEVQVIVVVDRDDRTGLHQHVFCLMHLGFTGRKVRFLVDVLDEGVVSGPVRRVVAAFVGVFLRGTAAGENCDHHGDRHQKGKPFSGSHCVFLLFFTKK